MENGKWREGGKEERPGVCDLVAVVIIIFCCLAFRLPRLDGQGLVLDELWHAEILAGNGSAHLRLPTDVLLSPPDLFTPVAPWWHIWGRVGMNHPPLNFILLRWWMSLFGGTDAS